MDDPAQLSEYGKILIILLIGALLVCATIFLARLISPKKNNPIKSGTYECGEDPIGSSWVQFNPRFYVIALVFLLFDVELIFIFPWATVFGQSEYIAADGRWGWFTMIEMAMFIGILILGLVFVWKKGDLEWVKPNVSLPKVPVAIPDSAYASLNSRTYQVRDYAGLGDETVAHKTTTDEQVSTPKPAFKPRFKKPE
ncbi:MULTISPECIES: NADH-quinone oxidoreductase subunit A [Sphingobacterium]|jgi:NADH-quinone oxidoreductase subunit A|uniref:NADH-quinone oxidoreductase subunit A n=1 Tax=Sphingobacterium TaxID=28453 RepID=UPI000EC56947|nr:MULTISPECIES: NADH-quinone oxidoreductase subunit A [Sphingobacterium]QQT63032.1 NADH-quinone oxidoreductase subunit A [Sphingobacterium multivorum]HAF34828.1 NADH-quinone oxidoreductase subunit A [Sphingobacterium sp.]